MEHYNYILKLHGDSIEKEYIEFISSYLPNYEKVWSVYIGNIGDNTKGKIIGYSQEKEDERQWFSEYSYTILLSSISLNRIKDNSDKIADFFDIHDNLILFFTHLGRIIDNLGAASSKLGIKIDFKEQFSGFYSMRNIIIHGKTIPIFENEQGVIEIPKISRGNLEMDAWKDKINIWEDMDVLQSNDLHTTLSSIYFEFISKVDQIFSIFHEKISDKLLVKGHKINFEYTNFNINNAQSSSIGNNGSSGNGIN